MDVHKFVLRAGISCNLTLIVSFVVFNSYGLRDHPKGRVGPMLLHVWNLKLLTLTECMYALANPVILTERASMN